ARHGAKGARQRIGGRGVTCDRLPARSIHYSGHAIPWLDPIGWRGDAVADRLTLRLDVEDTRLLAVPGQPAGIGRLPTPLGIEGRLFEEHIRLCWVSRDGEDVGNSRIDSALVGAGNTSLAPPPRRRASAGPDPA